MQQTFDSSQATDISTVSRVEEDKDEFEAMFNKVSSIPQ
jgi:hypothetical protein